MVRLVAVVITVQQLLTVASFAAVQLGSSSFAQLLNVVSVLNYDVQVCSKLVLMLTIVTQFVKPGCVTPQISFVTLFWCVFFNLL